MLTQLLGLTCPVHSGFRATIEGIRVIREIRGSICRIEIESGGLKRVDNLDSALDKPGNNQHTPAHTTHSAGP